MPRYPWPATALTPEDMAALYQHKQAQPRRTPITRLIAEAVRRAYGPRAASRPKVAAAARTAVLVVLVAGAALTAGCDDEQQKAQERAVQALQADNRNLQSRLAAEQSARDVLSAALILSGSGLAAALFGLYRVTRP